MGSRHTGLVTHPLYRQHIPRRGHPEREERYDAALNGVNEGAAPDALIDIVPSMATDAQLELCHRPDYLDCVKHDVKQGLCMLSTGDTELCPNSLDAARMAAGGTMAAVDAVCGGVVQNAFCAVRPPGHHATASRGMGFCIFNNAALAARWAQQQHGIERVLIVDWDVHHGNGTQDIFYEDPSVFYFSTHQWPFFPGTGAADECGSGEGGGTTLNCPLTAGADGLDLANAFQHRLFPMLREWQPGLVLVSAGFDAEGGDPLGGFALSPSDFANLTHMIMDVADRYAEGRVISILEGGYRLAGLASCVAAHMATLTGACSDDDVNA